jgi:FSR family fosmidomycin resistance protein-like MFS transporter
MGGVGAAMLGKFADAFSINAVYEACAFLPLIGLLAAFLPDVEKHGRSGGAASAQKPATA